MRLERSISCLTGDWWLWFLFAMMFLLLIVIIVISCFDESAPGYGYVDIQNSFISIFFQILYRDRQKCQRK